MSAPNMLAQVIAAATEFKLLLDIQVPGSLFNPGGKGDARESACYKAAEKSLAEAILNRNSSSNCGSLMHASVMPVGDFVPNHGANTPSNSLEVFEQLRKFILSLGLQECHQHAGSSEDGSFFELRLCTGRKPNETTELGDGKSSAVHV